MRSGTGLGPGICRKWRPEGWKSRSSIIGPCDVCILAFRLRRRFGVCTSRRAGATPARRDRRRGPVRCRGARPLRHRRVDLPGHADRRAGAEERPRRRRRHRCRARARRAGAGARRGHEPVRPDDRCRARRRHQQASAPGDRGRSRAAHGDGRARRRARSAQRAAEAARPLVSGRRLDQRAGDDRRHGRQQLVRLALDRVRQHGPQRAQHPRADGRRRRGRFRRGRWRDRPRRRDRRLRPRARPPSSRRDRSALAEGAAPGRRLQPRHLSSAK